MPSFAHINGTVVNFSKAPRRPDKAIEIIQAQRSTAGGHRFAYTHTVFNSLITANIRMNKAEKEDLVRFWNFTTRGMSENFVYIDEEGIFHNVKFFESVLSNIREVAFGRFEVTVLLRTFDNQWTWPSGDVLAWDSQDFMGA